MATVPLECTSIVFHQTFTPSTLPHVPIVLLNVRHIGIPFYIMTGYLDVGDGCWTHIQKYYDVSDLFKCNQHAEDVIKEYIYKEYREYVSRTMAIYHKNYNTDAHIAGYQVKMI